MNIKNTPCFKIDNFIRSYAMPTRRHGISNAACPNSGSVAYTTILNFCFHEKNNDSAGFVIPARVNPS
jgi:hypothetical protein